MKLVSPLQTITSHSRIANKSEYLLTPLFSRTSIKYPLLSVRSAPRDFSGLGVPPPVPGNPNVEGDPIVNHRADFNGRNAQQLRARPPASHRDGSCVPLTHALRLKRTSALPVPMHAQIIFSKGHGVRSG
jgi:hypothetical protein